MAESLRVQAQVAKSDYVAALTIRLAVLATHSSRRRFLINFLEANLDPEYSIWRAEITGMARPIRSHINLLGRRESKKKCKT